MILKIKSWCEGIIIAIIICIIIECLVPEGNNKKYIKVVIGIYIMFVILNPILDVLNYDFNFDNMFSSFEYQETYSSIDNEIKDVYVLGIEENIKEEIRGFGYIVEKVKVYVDINYENIEKIEIKISDNFNISNIEPVVIGNNYNTTSDGNLYKDIINHLVENYSVTEKQIFFK